MHSFTYDGVNCKSYCGLYVSGDNTYGAPERDVESIEIHGRNGALTIDYGSFKNIQVTYTGSIADNFYENSKRLRNWLKSRVGYRRLEDDYDPDYFRLARYIEPMSFQTIAGQVAGVIDVTFDCMPQRWLKSGFHDITITSGDILGNPTPFESQPKITAEITGNCTITINDQVISISDYTGTLIIDTEIQTAYDTTRIRNNKMTGDFPVLNQGPNTITFSENVTSLIIMPRWWSL